VEKYFCYWNEENFVLELGFAQVGVFVLGCSYGVFKLGCSSLCVLSWGVQVGAFCEFLVSIL
jgi:hypothetical protein